MEDERRRILEMVEQGRLSAQEANEILAALEEPEERPSVQPGEHHREPHRGLGDRGWLGESVGGVVDAVVRTLFGEPRGRCRRPGRRSRRGE